MQDDFKTIGKIDKNILQYLEQVVPSDYYQRLTDFLFNEKISENVILYLLIHENDNERLFTMRIDGREDDLYFRVKKGA